MTLKELLENTEDDTIVRVIMDICGTSFKAEHYPDGWLTKANEDLWKRKIGNIGTINGVLKVYLQ